MKISENGLEDLFVIFISAIGISFSLRLKTFLDILMFLFCFFNIIYGFIKLYIDLINNNKK